MPATFDQVGKLMRFNGLDAAPDMKLLTLASRCITDDSTEKWTARFNRVKARETAAMEAEVRTMIVAFRGGKYPESALLP